MNNPELYKHTPKHISERQELQAPAGWVSVFHETKTNHLDSINQLGLIPAIENKNIGNTEAMTRQNQLMDSCRPDNVAAKGISRKNIFAYPFLKHGHGLHGADRRFIHKSDEDLMHEFEALQQYEPNHLAKLRTYNLNDYIKLRRDPEHLKAQYPGEILELKVDPNKCYVGDLEYITRITDDISRGRTEEEAVTNQSEEYWSNLITLNDFLTWYRKPEAGSDGEIDQTQFRPNIYVDAYNFYPLVNSPENLPNCISKPEVLIPEPVPQKYIRVIQ